MGEWAWYFDLKKKGWKFKIWMSDINKKVIKIKPIKF